MNAEISIAVIGSINLDLVASVENFPQPGETVTNAVVRHFPGGKGANQALAAHRLGAEVYMVGRVGEDRNAEEALATLRDEGVNLSYCKTTRRTRHRPGHDRGQRRRRKPDRRGTRRQRRL